VCARVRIALQNSSKTLTEIHAKSRQNFSARDERIIGKTVAFNKTTPPLSSHPVSAAARNFFKTPSRARHRRDVEGEEEMSDLGS
jgi:hypothetical protein